jgi:hypothetical protein
VLWGVEVVAFAESWLLLTGAPQLLSSKPLCEPFECVLENPRTREPVELLFDCCCARGGGVVEAGGGTEGTDGQLRKSLALGGCAVDVDVERSRPGMDGVPKRTADGSLE